MGTRAAFDRMPEDVWCWYLFRRTVCNRSQPNGGHLALAEFEERFGDRFLLVTQNVDGLHLRAGNSLKRTYQVHGNINYMRCVAECNTEQFAIPEEVGDKERGQPLTAEQEALLVCPRCGGRTRPHILWFDECYDEERFRFHSSLEAARTCGMLVSVGSSGSTNLPTQMVRMAAGMGAVMVDVNPETNPYGQLAEASGGLWIKCGAGEGMERLKEALFG